MALGAGSTIGTRTYTAAACAAVAAVTLAGCYYWRRARAAGTLALLAASREAELGAKHLSSLLRAGDGCEAGDEGANPALNTRKLRYAVFAAKNRFGDPPKDIDRQTVDQWIRTYLAGRVPGSQFNCRPDDITKWTPLLVEAVFTPTPYAVAAALVAHNSCVTGMKVAYDKAQRPPTLFEVLLGIKPFTAWAEPVPPAPNVA